MLFDLRGAGRRRTVKAVYITLAFLMGGGLVLFGIGGGGALSGGLVDAITNSSNTGGGSGTERLQRAEQKATAAARANPEDAALWAEVARARFNLASANVDRNTGEFDAAGKRELGNASRAWEEHLKLAGDKPDSRVASLMVSAYIALGQVDKATTAQEVIALDRNSVGAYTQLAQLAYQAGQLRKGDLARDKALELTEPDMRESLKGQLEGLRAAAASQSAQQAVPTATPTPKPKDK
jgi:hypothetical protein